MSGVRPCVARAIEEADYAQWKPLRDGYDAFYGREGPTALAQAISRTAWERFFNPQEPVFALVAQVDDAVVGLAHFLYHRSTTRIEPSCYMQDLFTAPDRRGHGIGRALIQEVYARARADGCGRVYWQTHASNEAGRTLYDKVARHAGFIVYTHEL